MSIFRRWREGFTSWWREPNVIWCSMNETVRVNIEVRQWLALPLLIVLLGWYIAAPSVTVAVLLATVTGLIAWSYVWARQMALHLRGKRLLESAAMQVGDELEEQVSLSNQSFLPAIWVELADRSNLPGYVVSGVRGVGPFASTNWRAHTICKQRGVYLLGPWELRTGDPFGLFQVRQIYLQRQEILVYPPLAALPPDLLPHRGSQGDYRPLRQPMQAETIDSMSVRAYQPSDPLRHIHWPTTARTGIPYVKIFEPQAASRVWLLPDMNPSAQWGQAEESTEETAVILSASLAANLLQDKLAVGIFSGGDAPEAVLPQRGQIHLWSILGHLAPLHPQAGVTLARSLEQIQPLLSQRDLLLVITAALSEDWILSVRRLLRGRSGINARVLLLDPASFGGQDSAYTFLPVLAAAGLEGRVIQRGEIRPLIGAYGALSRWEFTTLGTGRVVARQTPRRAAAIFAGQKAVE